MFLPSRLLNCVSLLTGLGMGTMLIPVAQANEIPSHHIDVSASILNLNFTSKAGEVYAVQPGVATFPGARTKVSNVTSLISSIIYHFNPRWGIETILTAPFRQDISGTGSLSAFGKIGSFKQVSPTLNVLYYPQIPGLRKWHPFIGVGRFYTHLYDEQANDSYQQAISASTSQMLNTQVAISNVKLRLKSGWGTAFKIGTQYDLTPKIYLGFSVAYLRFDTKSTTDAVGTLLNGKTIPVQLKENIRLNTMGYELGIGMRF